MDKPPYQPPTVTEIGTLREHTQFLSVVVDIDVGAGVG